MSKRVKVGYTDKTIWDAERKDFVGDMAYAFCDMADTRVLEKDIDDTLRPYNWEYIDSQEAEEWGDVGNGRDTDFVIYEIHTADLIVDDDDEDEKDEELALYLYPLDYDTDKIVEVYVCATEEDAREIVNERYGYNVKAYYRDEE